MSLRDRLYLILAGIFIASLVSCNLIFQKFFHWTPVGEYTFYLSVGILPYPLTFLVTDILSELYGKKKADQVVVTGFIASVFTIAVVLVANAVPATTWSKVDNETFTHVFGLAPAAVFASMVAYLTAQFIDIRLFHFWKRLTRGKHLWLRNNASTVVSQLVDSSAVLALLCCFPDTGVTWDKFSNLLLNAFLFKVIFAAFDTPLFYLAVAYLRPRIGGAPEDGGENPAETVSTAHP